MPRLPARLRILAVLPIVLACHGTADQGAAASQPSDSGRAAGILAMPEPVSKPDTQVAATVLAVTNDVKALRAATPAAAVGKLPAHEQLVNGMLTNFETRIRAMHVQADPAWTSVIDSVRTDLARLPAMKSDSLQSFLPGHLNRVMRIVACIQMVKS
ncbi:MAG: hypothetical protein M3Y05_14105 [Gemmatimonadota bacterium]|nr:hypothetical protein [Gemmatimonadota bacterium]